MPVREKLEFVPNPHTDGFTQKDLSCLQDTFLIKGPFIDFTAHNQHSLTEQSTVTAAPGVDALMAFLVRAPFPIA